MAAAPDAANAEDAMQVERVGPGAGAAPARKSADSAPSDGFAELLDAPAATGGSPAAAVTSAQMAVIGLPMDDDPTGAAEAANQRARHHGRAMLRALRDLQAGLLCGPQDAASATLADLAARMPETDDPVLRQILREIGARAAVELARHGAAANISIA